MAYFPVNVLDNAIKAMPTVKAISNTPIATFDTDIADRLVNLNVAVTATGGGGTPSTPIPISGFSACNLSVNGTTHAISFGQTVYGAILDPLSGKLTITHQIVNYDGSETWNYTSSLNRVYINIPTVKKASVGGVEPIISNILHYSGGNKEDYGTHINDQGNLIVFAPSTITTASDWQTWLQSNPLQVVYELATPIEIQLSSADVQAIIGNNNIYADTGDIIELKFVLSVGKAIS